MVELNLDLVARVYFVAILIEAPHLMKRFIQKVGHRDWRSGVSFFQKNA